MDVSTGVQDVNITVTPPPALAIAVPAVTNVTMPITGVGGLKGDKGDTGAPGTTDYNALSNKPTLGTAAATAVTDYATAAQGTKADSAVQPATLTTGLATKANTSHTHSQADVSSLVSDLAAKQATLVSGTNIKTINGTTLLGSGDLTIAGGGGSGTVTSVTSATADATVATTTTTPVITIVSAPKLTTARTINGVLFDGTANITVADSTKEPTVTAGTTAQYYRGDKTWQTHDKASVGLANVDNTSDATKNGAIATLANKTLAAPVVTTSLSALDAPITTGSTADVLGTALSVMRNSVAVGRIDNNANGLRVQAQTGSLQLRGTGNTGLAIDSSGNTVAAGTIDATGLTVASVAVPTISSTSTLTNKRLTARVGTVASSATPTPTGDTADMYTVTALAAGATFAAPTGTPTDGQELTLRVKDNGTAQTLAFNAIYRFSSDLAAPTTTVISKTLYMKFRYNAADIKWDCLAWLNNF